MIFVTIVQSKIVLHDFNIIFSIKMKGQRIDGWIDNKQERALNVVECLNCGNNSPQPAFLSLLPLSLSLPLFCSYGSSALHTHALPNHIRLCTLSHTHTPFCLQNFSHPSAPFCLCTSHNSICCLLSSSLVEHNATEGQSKAPVFL